MCNSIYTWLPSTNPFCLTTPCFYRDHKKPIIRTAKVGNGVASENGVFRHGALATTMPVSRAAFTRPEGGLSLTLLIDHSRAGRRTLRNLSLQRKTGPQNRSIGSHRSPFRCRNRRVIDATGVAVGWLVCLRRWPRVRRLAAAQVDDNLHRPRCIVFPTCHHLAAATQALDRRPARFRWGVSGVLRPSFSSAARVGPAESVNSVSTSTSAESIRYW